MAVNLGSELFELYRSRPRVVILMSGLGTNARSILDSESIRDLYDVAAIATDNSASAAAEIAEGHGLEVLIDHQNRFASSTERDHYFGELSQELGTRSIQGAIYAGFMKITPPLFTRRFPGLNIHPANLLVTDEGGLPKYRGMNALSAMRRELGYVQSSVHVVDTLVDTGTVVALTRPLAIDEGITDTDAHKLLKHEECYTFPAVLQQIGTGELCFGDDVPTLVAPEGGIS